MYEVALTESVAQRFLLPAGGKYLLENANAAEAVALSDCQTISIVPYQSDPPKGNNPLIVRAGGIGDLLMLSALLPLFIERHGKVSVAAFESPLSVLKHLPEHAKGHLNLIQYPAKWNWNYTSITALEGCVESNNELHPIKAMGLRLNLDLPDVLPLPRYVVTAPESAWAFGQVGESKKTRIAVQLHASAQIRSLPHNLLHELISLLIENDFEVVLFGDPGTWQGDHPSIINITDRGYSFRESAAVFSICDALIAPDSAFVHLAAALEKPAVALYGPFHWQQRTAHYPTVRALQGHAPCAPCHHHVRFGQRYPINRPCNLNGWCAAMGTMEPRRIIQTLKKVL